MSYDEVKKFKLADTGEHFKRVNERLDTLEKVIIPPKHKLDFKFDCIIIFKKI